VPLTCILYKMQA